MLSEKNLIIQSNPLIEARYSLGETEQKLLRVLISMIKPNTDTLEKRFYRLTIQDFVQFLDRKDVGAIHREMRRMVRHLMNAHVRIIKPNGNIIETSWITSFEYPQKLGWIEFEISSKLENELLRVKEQFTQYYLANISKLKGEYSVRIYELVQQYANSNMGSRTMDIEELRTLLVLPEAYKRSSNLFQRVIRPAHKEICAKTDITFSYQTIKEARKIVAVEFFDIQKKTAIAPSTLSLIPKKYRENKDILKNITKYLELHGPEYVTEKLQYVASRKDIGNYPDYLYSALQKNHGEGFSPPQESLTGTNEHIDFSPGTVFEFGGRRYTFDGNGLRISETKVLGPEEIDQAIKMGLLNMVPKEILQKERMEQLTKEFEEHRQNKVDAYMTDLSPQEREDLREKFVSQGLNDISREIYNQSGMGSLIIRALFAEFVAKLHLPELSLTNFIREKEQA